MRYVILGLLIVFLMVGLIPSQEKKQSAKAKFEEAIFVESESEIVMEVKNLVKEDFVYITIRTTFDGKKKVFEIKRLR